MKNTPAYILFCLFALFSVWGVAGCRKKDNPKPDSQTTYNTIHLSGKWTGIGTASSSNSYDSPDAFDEFDVVVVNDSVIVVWSDTLYLDPAFLTVGIMKFSPRMSPHSSTETELSYSVKHKSIAFYRGSRTSYGSASMRISTALYHPNPSIGTFVDNIAGLKAMSGTLYDTSWFRPFPSDSGGPVDVSITFTKIDDSTLTFDNDVLRIVGPPSPYNENHLLHYKLTDSLAKTVVFQNFHLYGVAITTLTYYYETQTLMFEQQLRATAHFAYLKLQ